MEIQFESNEKYTWIGVSDFMATTFKREIIIMHSNDAGRWIFKHKGKRKEYFFPKDTKDMLIFKGHNLPFIVDSETDRFFGNAKLNFVTDDPLKLKAHIKEYCINPDLATFSSIRVTPTDRNKVDGEGEALYPETNTEED